MCLIYFCIYLFIYLFKKCFDVHAPSVGLQRRIKKEAMNPKKPRKQRQSIAFKLEKVTLRSQQKSPSGVPFFPRSRL